MVSASKLIKASYDAGKSFFHPPLVQDFATPAAAAVSDDAILMSALSV
jgi:hypothetical protein